MPDTPPISSPSYRLRGDAHLLCNGRTLLGRHACHRLQKGQSSVQREFRRNDAESIWRVDELAYRAANKRT